jgi:hypothetical protein
MKELNISNFNIAFFQPPRNPLQDDVFSEILSSVLSHFPLVDQASNPILVARRKEGGEISMSPVFIQFLNFDTKDFDSDLKVTKEISDIYFLKYNTEKVHQIAIRLVSITEASIKNGERQLIKNEGFKLHPDNAKIMNPDEEVKIGVRLVFRRDDKRYDLKIEPYFKQVEKANYIDFNVVLSNLNMPPGDVYNSLDKEIFYFKHDISKLIP